MQPVLHTPRLTLRPVTTADVEPLWVLWTHPRVRRYLWDDRSISREEATIVVADCMALGASGLGLWVLEGNDTGGIRGAAPNDDAGALGCAGLLPVSTAARYDERIAGLVEPIVVLAPAARGQGFAQEALAALIVHAAETLGLTHIAGVTDVPNTPSDRMLRRAGFRVLGEVPGPKHPLRTYLLDVDRPGPSSLP